MACPDDTRFVVKWGALSSSLLLLLLSSLISASSEAATASARASSPTEPDRPRLTEIATAAGAPLSATDGAEVVIGSTDEAGTGGGASS